MKMKKKLFYWRRRVLYTDLRCRDLTLTVNYARTPRSPLQTARRTDDLEFVYKENYVLVSRLLIQ